MLEVQSLQPAESVPCFTVFPSQRRWQSPKGPKNYVWHFPSSPAFLCPLRSCCYYTDRSECTNVYTLVQQSLAWDVYGPSTFSVYSRIAFFCLCLIPCFCQSRDPKSGDLGSKCPACVSASITPELRHECIYQLSYAALS